MAWHDLTPGNGEIYVRRWSGTAWEDLGGAVSGNPGMSQWPLLELDERDRPIVAWQDNTSGNWEVYLRRWDGREWTELAGSAAGGGVSRTPQDSFLEGLAVDAQGRPVVTWEEIAPPASEVFLRRWNGNAWEELDGSATGGGISRTSGPSKNGVVAVDAAGHPVVAWHDEWSGDWEVYLRRWDGRAWIDVGGSAAAGGVSRRAGLSAFASLALDRKGNPVLAWYDNASGANRIYLRRWR